MVKLLRYRFGISSVRSVIVLLFSREWWGWGDVGGLGTGLLGFEGWVGVGWEEKGRVYF